MAYVKLFASILDSTVWETDPATRVVWITLLAMADRDGLVEASVPGLARRAGVERGECERALALFEAPDPDSRTTEHEGRRVKPVDGGWVLLNYEKYRDKATKEEAASKAAARQKRYRDRERAKRNGDVTQHNARNERNEMTRVTDSAAAAPSASASEEEPPSGVNARAREADQVPTVRQRTSSRRIGAELIADVTTKMWDAKTWGDDMRWIGERPDVEREAVAKHLRIDRWVSANPGLVNPGHVRKFWHKYVDGPRKVLADDGEDKRERARLRRLAIEDARITLQMSDDETAIAAARKRLAELEGGA